jgi:hypothetical protein
MLRGFVGVWVGSQSWQPDRCWLEHMQSQVGWVVWVSGLQQCLLNMALSVCS